MTTATKPKTPPEVGELLSRAVATDRGLVPMGHVWDEEAQQAIPLGLAVREDSIRQGEDLEENLKRMARDRKLILKFIAEQLVESEYDAKGRPVKGKMHDYYTLPGYDKKTPTKQGGEKIAQFFKLRRAKTESVERVCTKEFAMAAVRVELVDKWGMPAGSGEAAATTAETGFQGAAAKYGQRKDQGGKITQEADWRAAFNDIIARAGKRAFNQAVIYATATDDIFDATGEIERVAEGAGVTEEDVRATRPRFPEKFGNVSGKLVEEVATDALVKVSDWCRTKAKNQKAVAPILEAVEDELERRRAETEGDVDDGPTV